MKSALNFDLVLFCYEACFIIFSSSPNDTLERAVDTCVYAEAMFSFGKCISYFYFDSYVWAFIGNRKNVIVF